MLRNESGNRVRCVAPLLVVLACILPLLGVKGCLDTQDVAVSLLAEPETLNFGSSKDELVLKVSRAASDETMEPLVVIPSAPWIIPAQCTDTAENCISSGVLDKLKIPVHIDREQMQVGSNQGTLELRTGDASVRHIDVVAEDWLAIDFAVSNPTPAVNQPVRFSDQTLTVPVAGRITERVWDFGDGNTSNVENPSHTYRAAGYYTVSLTVTTEERQETRVREAFVAVGSSVPAADFEADRTVIVEQESVRFTDLTQTSASAVISRQWDFGDGSTSTELNPRHQYLQAGAYTVSLTVSTAQNTMTATKENFILVQRRVAPVADFGTVQPEAYVFSPVQFRDLSEPGSAEISQWIWEFGDGTISREQNPTHIYQDVAAYNVKLTVISVHGNSSISKTVDVKYTPPAADFEADNTTPSVLEEVQFTDMSRPGTVPIVAWEWDFGDGTTSTEQAPIHQYEQSGLFTVSLTVTTSAPTNNSDTLVKEDYIEVLDPPSPDFEVDSPGPLTTQELQFTNLTEPGSEDIINYVWNFGEGGGEEAGSTEPEPTYQYEQPGVYTVTLTAETATREASISKDLVVDAPPLPDFEAEPLNPTTLDPVQFTDISETEDRRPIIGRQWNFGDGETSTAVNPRHTYDTPGTYAVQLAVQFIHSGTGYQYSLPETKQNYISVSPPESPVAMFEADNPCAVTNVPVRFMDLSQDGSREITAWLWEFGDGATSTRRRPEHTYSEPGIYTVSLTVTSEGLTPPFDSDTLVLEEYVTVAEGRELDRYVRQDDGIFQWRQVDSFEISEDFGAGDQTVASVHVLEMDSQVWHAADVEDGDLWSHNLTIIEPAELAQGADTALLFIDGGSRSSSAPTADSIDDFLWQIAAATGTYLVHINNVPSQPLVFVDEYDYENNEPIRSRSEDAIIAYSFDKYMESYVQGDPDPTWPVLFAMAKAAVRGMDAAQEFLGQGVINDFVVAGASKRGWTTWMTALADCRVSACAPIVIDVLNMDEQMLHHRSAYGYWAPSIYEYAQMRVFDRLIPEDGQLLPESEALLRLVDPYEYRDRMDAPGYAKRRLILNSTGDQFFLSDSSQFYYDSLPNENRLNYVPNTDHGLGLDEADITEDMDNAVGHFLAWYLSTAQDIEPPSLNWTVTETGMLKVYTDPEHTVQKVTLWQASNPDARDFRRETIGEAWSSETLTEAWANTYRHKLVEPPAGWKAYVVQVQYQNEAQFALNIPGFSVPEWTFTTDVFVVPDVYPAFEGTRDDSSGIPVLKLWGGAYDMGYDYGGQMQEEIGALLPNLVANSGFSTATLDDTWNEQSALMSQRMLDEIQGIADGAELPVELVRRAHMVPILQDREDCVSNSLVAWPPISTGGIYHGVSLNGPLNLSLQDYPCAVLYVPDEGIPHMNITSAGLAFGYTGINLGGISLSNHAQLGGAAPATGSQHYLPFFRETLSNAVSLREAFGWFDLFRPLGPGTALIGDGRFERRGGKVFFGPNSPPAFIYEGDPNDTVPLVLNGTVYGGQNEMELFQVIAANSGRVNESRMQQMTMGLGALVSENLVNVVYDNEYLDIYIQFASGGAPAYQRPFITINMQDMMP